MLKVLKINKLQRHLLRHLGTSNWTPYFENPEKEWLEILARTDESPPELELVFR